MKVATFLFFACVSMYLAHAEEEEIKKQVRTPEIQGVNMLQAANSKSTAMGNFECRFNQCPAGWQLLDYDLCVLMRPNAANREDAAADCKSLGAGLALVRYSSERLAYGQYLMREVPVGNNGMWLSAIRRGQQWFTSQLRSWTYSYGWAPGEPNYENGDCVELFTQESALNTTYWGHLGMDNCNNLRNYACELSAYDTTNLVCNVSSPPENMTLYH